MQFSTLAITQALLATAFALPVAATPFSLTAVNQAFPEGKAISVKEDGTVWIVDSDSSTQIMGMVDSANSVYGVADHGLTIGENNELTIGSTPEDQSVFIINDEGILTDANGHHAIAGEANEHGERQLFWGDADSSNMVDLHANLGNHAVVLNGADLKNNLCLWGCSGNKRPQHHAPQYPGQYCPPPVECAPIPIPEQPCCPPAPIYPADPCVQPPIYCPPPQHQQNSGCCKLSCKGCCKDKLSSLCDLMCPSTWCNLCNSISMNGMCCGSGQQHPQPHYPQQPYCPPAPPVCEPIVTVITTSIPAPVWTPPVCEPIPAPCVPQQCVPQQCVPQQCAPQQCAPQQCAPQQCAPQYPAQCAPQSNGCCGGSSSGSGGCWKDLLCGMCPKKGGMGGGCCGGSAPQQCAPQYPQQCAPVQCAPYQPPVCVQPTTLPATITDEPTPTATPAPEQEDVVEIQQEE